MPYFAQFELLKLDEGPIFLSNPHLQLQGSDNRLLLSLRVLSDGWWWCQRPGWGCQHIKDQQRHRNQWCSLGYSNGSNRTKSGSIMKTLEEETPAADAPEAAAT